jgi:hypothetical protein
MSRPEGKPEPRALARSFVSFEGTASAVRELLRSPVSGQPCVHWRLRIVEHLTPRTQLVHEVASPEPFDLAWKGTGEDGRPVVQVRLDPESARIVATPVLHREGTPGSLAAVRHFGLQGPVSVEEVLIRHGEGLAAEGILDDASTPGDGPFRAVAQALTLMDATVRTESRSLAPALLPWALGTAAALLGGMGLATYAAWRYHLLHLPVAIHLPRGLAPQARIQPPEIPHPRFP